MKHKNLLLIIFGILFLSCINAQPALQWTRSFNSPANTTDYGDFIATGPGGITFVTGISNQNIMAIAYSSSGQKLWTQIYDGTGNASDVPTGIAADTSGNLFVTGYTQNIDGNYDWIIIKYDISGNEKWKKTYKQSGFENERAYALALDGYGNIYVAGTGINVDTGIVTIKYNSSGNEIWQKVFSGPDPGSIEIPKSITLDASGNIYILGSCTRSATGQDYVVIKYANWGTKLWASFYDSGNQTEVPSAIGLDAANNVIITGYQYSGSLSTSNFLTVSFDSNGNQNWAQTYNGPNSGKDQATDLAIDNLGNVILTGFSEKSSTENYLTTLKYNNAGVQQWVDNWWVPGGAGNNRGNSIVVNPSGDVYVTGLLDSVPGEYAATIKYDSNGNRLWQNLYNPLNGIHMEGIQNTLDESGNILSTGVYDFLGGAMDFLTMKIDPSGNLLWANIEDGRTLDYMQTKEGITTDASGNIYIAGTSTNTSGNSDIVTLKYDKQGNLLWSKYFNGAANGDDNASSIGIDGLGNVYVSGSSGAANGMADWVTIKYSGSGIIQWAVTYNGAANDYDWPTAMKIDTAGNVFVTGYTRAGAGPTLNGNIATIKYNTNGAQQWLSIYNDAFNEEDLSNDIQLDGSGNVFIAGSARNNANQNLLALKYNSSGVQQWVWTLNSGNAVNQLKAIRISNTGLVIAAGNFWNGTNQVVIVARINNSTGSATFSFSNLPYKQEFIDMLFDSQNYIYIRKSIETNGPGSYTPYIEKWDSTYSSRYWEVQVSIPNSQFFPSLGNLKLSKLNYLYLTIPSLNNTNTQQYAALKYDTDGNLLWYVQQGDSPNRSTSYSSCIDDSSNLTITGTSYLTNNNGISHLTNRIFTVRYAENIQTNALSSSAFCQGAPVTIPFTVMGTLSVSNVFTAQLSDASGSFNTPVILGSVVGTGTGTINTNIPVSTPAGTAYRIRVVSSNPVLTSLDNGSDITVNANPVTSITGITGLCNGSPAALTAHPTGTYLWSTTETTQTIHPTDPGTYTVTVTTASGCSKNASVAVVPSGNPSPTITIYDEISPCQEYVGLSTEVATSYLWSNNSTYRSMTAYSSGAYSVTVTNAFGCTGTSAPANVTVLVPDIPSISSFTPVTAIPGATVTINGLGFNPDSSKNVVYFGACKGLVISATANQLQVIVPGGATYDRICVIVNPILCGHIGYSKEFFIPKFNCPNTSLQFSASPTSITNFNAAKSIKIADIDGDGKPDILLSHFSLNIISILRNTSSSGALTFTLPYTISTGAAGGQIGIDCADMDGDGKLDVIMTNSTSNFITLLRNTSSPAPGPISFDSPVVLPVSSPPEGLALGDFDNDGTVDIAVSKPNSYPNTQIVIFKNTNIAGIIDPDLFLQQSIIDAGSYPRRIATADIDKDGKTDLISVNSLSNSISVFRNVSNPSYINFNYKVDFATGTTPNGGLGVADFDNDSKMDIIVTNITSNSFSIFRNTATSAPVFSAGTFAARQDFSAGTGPTRLSIADFDGDGKPDVILLAATFNLINIYRNTSSGPGNLSFASAVSYTNDFTNPTDLASGDLNNDAHTDFIYSGGDFANLLVRRSTVSSATITTTGSTTFCPGGSVHLTASAGVNYLWNTGATTQSIHPFTAGYFNVTVNGCTSTPVFTTLNPSPLVSISPDGPTDICPGSNVTLSATPGYSSYYWSNGSTDTTMTTGDPGSYTVTAANSYGCTASSAPQTITIKEINNVAPGVSMSKVFGGSASDAVGYTGDSRIEVNPDGSYVLCGSTLSNDGDVTGFHGSSDAWIIKTSANGSLLWEKSVGGSALDALNSINKTMDNGYICAGYTYSNDGDVSGNHGSYDAWLVKLDSMGEIQWQKCYGSWSTEIFNSAIQTSDTGYLCTGYHSEVRNGDVSMTYGGNDLWIVKVSAGGIIEWEKTFGGSSNENGNSLIALSDGNFAIAGSTMSNDSDVTVNHGGTDIWILKINSSGSKIWQKSLGGSSDEDVRSIKETANGYLILGGTTKSSDGDVTGFHGFTDYWIVKLNSSGNLIWQKSLGGSNQEQVAEAIESLDDGILVAGSSQSIDGDVIGNHDVNINDVWLVKLDSSGSILWKKCYGGTGNDIAGSVYQHADASYSIAGYTSSNNGDVSENHGSNDVWLLHLKNPVITSDGPLTLCSGDTVTLSVQGGISYEWSNGSNAASLPATESGNYAVTADGCFTSDTVQVIVRTCDFSMITRTYIEGFYKGGASMIPALDPLSMPTVCDTVRLQLYRPVFPYDLLYEDTAMMDLQGYSAFSFLTNPEYDNYYLSFRHRNTLETWSAVPVVIDGNIKSYDFTTAASQAYGNNLKDLGDTRFAMYSGDTNQDGAIDSTDFSNIENALNLFAFGYIPEDLTGDNLTENADYSLIENNLQLFLILQRP